MPTSCNKKHPSSIARMTAVVIVAIASIIFPTSAKAFPWLLYTDGVRLRFLAPGAVYQPIDLYPWSWGNAVFSASVEGDVLRLELSADIRETLNWCAMCVLSQYRDGRVLVSWWVENAPCEPVTFARFASFDEAWSDPRVRHTFAPALSRLHQPLPTVEALRDATTPLAATEGHRQAIERLLPGLDSSDPRTRRRAREALRKEPRSLLREMRTRSLSANQRNALGSLAGEGVELTDGQWELVLESDF